MKWLLFTNIDTDINDNIIRMRCCLTDYKFQRIIFTEDFELNQYNNRDFTNDIIEYEIIRYINDNVAIKDKIYLVYNFKSKRINDSDLIHKKMNKLSKYIREGIDLSSLWLIMDIYNVSETNMNTIDNCMIKVYGSLLDIDNIGNEVTM